MHTKENDKRNISDTEQKLHVKIAAIRSLFRKTRGLPSVLRKVPAVSAQESEFLP